MFFNSMSTPSIKDKREKKKQSTPLGAEAPSFALPEEEQIPSGGRGRCDDDLVIGASQYVLPPFIDKEDNTVRECSASGPISSSDLIIGSSSPNINGRGQSIPCDDHDIQDANCTQTQEYQPPIQSSCKSAEQSHTSIEEPGLLVGIVPSKPRLSGRIPIQGALTFREGENWKLEKRLGEGTYAETYSVKVIDPKAINGCEQLCLKKMSIGKADGEVTLEDACREVEIMSRIGLHENIVWCLGAQFIETTKTFNIFLDIIPGGTVKELLDSKCGSGCEESIPTMYIRNMVKQVMCGLVFLNSKGIAHWDLNAGNIMLGIACTKTRIPRIRLIDFGISVVRCEQCIDCNERIEYIKSLDCDECGKWHDGRADDVQETAYLTYRLLMVPTPTEEGRCRFGEMIRGAKKKDQSLSVFVEGCINLKPTAALYDFLAAEP